MEVKKSKSVVSRLLLLCGIALITALFAYFAVQIVDHRDYHNSDFFTFWLSGRMVLTGQNAYNTTDWVAGHHNAGVTWIPNQQFVYPLPLSFIYAPLGIFSLHTAYIIWVTLLEWMVLAAVLMLLRINQKVFTNPYFFPILAGAVLFRPVMAALFGGQIDGFLLFLLCITIVLMSKGKWFAGGMCLALIALKPNIGIPILILAGLWMLAGKKGHALAGIFTSAILLTLSGMILNPHWVFQYLAIGKAKMDVTFGYSPTVWGILSYSDGFRQQTTLVIGGIITVVILLGSFVLLLRYKDKLTSLSVIGLAICVTLLVTPYTWSYDQVLLIIPIISILQILRTMKAPYLLNATLFLALDGLALIMLWVSSLVYLEIPNVVLTIVIFILQVIFILLSPVNSNMVKVSEVQ